ncbi:hypothetical protein ABZ829_22270 [Streptomyces xanthochromogenes]|uniref:hypothetical protein n=1 Tax=Streptomyces xanthochromogenes TaxID=67384 RepID=UPI00343E1048
MNWQTLKRGENTVNSGRTVTKVAGPILAAVAVGAVAVIGLTANSSTDEAASSPVGTAGEAAPADPAKPFIGNADDPATWKLPVEAYTATKPQSLLVSKSRDQLMKECMTAAGFPQWTPAPDLPTVGGKTLTDWRYGIHDTAQAAKRGYHPDAEAQKAYDQAMVAGAVDKSGADKDKLRSCAAAADAQVPAVQTSDVVDAITGDSYKESAKDPKVVAVFAQWSSCMKAKGYAYKEPLDTVDDPRFHNPREVSSLEIATAQADLECRSRFPVARTWFDAESALQMKAIKSHQSELSAVKAENAATVSKASRIAAAK